MSSAGPLTDPDALRKNVSGTVFGFPPVSSTWEAKFVICATTRHGAVTGASRSRLVTATVSALAGARSVAGRAARRRGGRGADVSILATASAVPAHQASEVR